MTNELRYRIHRVCLYLFSALFSVFRERDNILINQSAIEDTVRNILDEIDYQHIVYRVLSCAKKKLWLLIDACVDGSKRMSDKWL